MSAAAHTLLTVSALAHNEGDELFHCFASLKPLIEQPGTEALIVLDSRADERTARAAHQITGKVITNPFASFAAQRNRALAAASGDWVFFIDPDERATPELAAEIADRIHHPECAAYRVPRRNFMFGHEVRHTGWWPDYQVRLMERERVHYDESREVHEVPVADGPIGTLKEPLIHFNYRTWSQFFKKQWKYAPYEARSLLAAGTMASPRSLLGQPAREFKRRLVDYEGYKDGLLGLALSAAMALYVAETYRQLWRLQREK